MADSVKIAVQLMPQVDKLFRNRNLIGDTSVDEQAALFDWMRKQLPAAMLKRRGDLADYGRSVVHLTIAYIVVPDRARGDLLTIEEMLHDMCQAQHAEEPLLASDLHMELCGFDVYNNENVRAHRRNVGAYFELSVEGSPRGERLQAALERAASRLEKAVAQHEGLQKLGVTFRTDNNDPHITVHKYESVKGGRWAGRKGLEDLYTAAGLIQEALQESEYSVPVAALQVGYLTGWGAKVWEGKPEYAKRMQRPHAGDEYYVPRIWSSQQGTLLTRDPPSPRSGQEGADKAAEHPEA